ncbi:MAG: hypothetical protein AAF289_15140, partial [Cyanobacteria bacterium P01_A01_bin.135]
RSHTKTSINAMTGDHTPTPAAQTIASTAANSSTTRTPAQQTIPQGETILTVGVMVVTGLLVFLGRSLLKSPRKAARTQRRRPPLPCQTCRFKGDSVHLRCAVHPYRAMTNEALDCPDYWAKDSDKFERSLF